MYLIFVDNFLINIFIQKIKKKKVFFRKFYFKQTPRNVIKSRTSASFGQKFESDAPYKISRIQNLNIHPNKNKKVKNIYTYIVNICLLFELIYLVSISN